MLKHIETSKAKTVAMKAVHSHATVLKYDFLIMKGLYLKVKDGLMDLLSLWLNISFKLILHCCIHILYYVHLVAIYQLPSHILEAVDIQLSISS